MPFYVVQGEPRPRVYTDAGAARKACTSPLWEIKTFHTLAEASAAREQCRKRGAQEGERKKARVATPVLSVAQFKDLAGEVEEEENAGFGTWMQGQQFGDVAQFHDAEKLREEAEAKEWYEHFKAEQEAKARRREAERRMYEEQAKERARNPEYSKPRPKPQPQFRPQQQQEQSSAPPPVKPPARMTATEAMDVLHLGGRPDKVAEELLKAAKKREALLHHPDKHSEADKPHETVLFRRVMEAYTLLSGMFFPKSKSGVD